MTLNSEHWSSGLYKSTRHRVVNRSRDKYRVSVPFFYEPNYDAVITPLKIFSSEQGYVSKFGSKPITYGDYVSTKILTNFDFNYEDNKH
jgi:isopenicillin N synthase-like dioxygenase